METIPALQGLLQSGISINVVIIFFNYPKKMFLGVRWEGFFFISVLIDRSLVDKADRIWIKSLFQHIA